MLQLIFTVSSVVENGVIQGFGVYFALLHDEFGETIERIEDANYFVGRPGSRGKAIREKRRRGEISFTPKTPSATKEYFVKDEAELLEQFRRAWEYAEKLGAGCITVDGLKPEEVEFVTEALGTLPPMRYEVFKGFRFSDTDPHNPAYNAYEVADIAVVNH